MVKKIEDNKENQAKLVEDQVKQAENRVKQAEDQMKRAVADYRNLQARVIREKEDFAKYANERLFLTFLPVRDALVRALKQLGETSGVELILKQFDDTLSQEGVIGIDIKSGAKFDPEIMEAIDSVKAESSKKVDVVVEVLRAGFKYKEHVLRPAEVRVYK